MRRRYAGEGMRRGFSYFCVLVAAVSCALPIERCGAEVPELTAAQRTAVDVAVDDRDWNDAAFAALVENARLWQQPIGDVMVRNNPDFEAMLENPSNYRSDLCLIRGVLQQRNRLPEPYRDVEEWFIRNEAGLPIHVFVIMPEVATQSVSFRDGARVEVLGRYYKRTFEPDTPSGEMRYPAFIGAFPRATSGVASGSIAMPVWLPVVVIVMLAVFAVLFMRVRRLRRGERRVGSERWKDEEASDLERQPLPEDPAAALAELRQRAGQR